MTNPSQPENDRLLDLLAMYAVQELTEAEREELKVLLEQEDGVTPAQFEIAAAAMHLAMSESHSLPDSLADRVLADASEMHDTPDPDEWEPPATPTQPAVVPPTPVNQTSRFTLREGLAWLVAAAALVLFILNRPATETAVVAPVPPGTAAARQSLLEVQDTVRLDWQALDDPTAAGASGDVVWNTKRQTGFMRIADLQKNDPSEFQYQLWIFDKTQEHPIDGGVFDMTDAEQLIPIDPKIAASDVFQFAVTVEKPGGVVVSKKERIPLLAVLTQKL